VDSRKPSKDEALLVSVAESVGSTLGTLAAKANAFQKALTPGAKPGKRRPARAKGASRKRKGGGKRTGGTPVSRTRTSTRRGRERRTGRRP